MKFRGEYWFLSNMYNAPVTYNGVEYQNAEAAYQAQKQILVNPTASIDDFKTMTGIEAKKYAHTIKMTLYDIKKWNFMRDKIMYEIVKSKFSQNKYLKWRLLKTQDLDIIEENWWNDTYWGQCNGIGENKLGEILMRVRDELK